MHAGDQLLTQVLCTAYLTLLATMPTISLFLAVRPAAESGIQLGADQQAIAIQLVHTWSFKSDDNSSSMVHHHPHAVSLLHHHGNTYTY